MEGRRSTCVTCHRAVTRPPVSLHSPVVAVTHIGSLADLNVISEKMAKKRRERRETDGVLSAQEEVKTNANDSQVLKGRFWLWWLTVNVNVERSRGQQILLLGDTDRLSNIPLTIWQRLLGQLGLQNMS